MKCSARLRKSIAKTKAGVATAAEAERAANAKSYMIYVNGRLGAVYPKSESETEMFARVAKELLKLNRYLERAIARRSKALADLESGLAEAAEEETSALE